MRMEIERERFTEIEFSYALEQLTGGGYLTVGPDGSVSLTNAGIDRCCLLEKSLGIESSLCLQVFYELLRRASNNEQAD